MVCIVELHFYDNAWVSVCQEQLLQTCSISHVIDLQLIKGGGGGTAGGAGATGGAAGAVGTVAGSRLRIISKCITGGAAGGLSGGIRACTSH